MAEEATLDAMLEGFVRSRLLSLACDIYHEASLWRHVWAK